jgi:SsrA-binding protein
MAGKKKKKKTAPGRVVAQNRRARHDYFIDETVEAGLVLQGSEVKSLREGKGGLSDSYAGPEGGEMWLHNAYIPEYAGANRFNHETRRSRKLLLKKREIAKLDGLVRQKGVTLIPLAIYFNDRGIAKVELGVARGKKQYDKRETRKDQDWQRQKERLLKQDV